jgi:hypothetical protein
VTAASARHTTKSASPTERNEDACEDGLQANDVFIVEGRQERYGSKTAWQLV